MRHLHQVPAILLRLVSPFLAFCVATRVSLHVHEPWGALQQKYQPMYHEQWVPIKNPINHLKMSITSPRKTIKNVLSRTLFPDPPTPPHPRSPPSNYKRRNMSITSCKWTIKKVLSCTINNVIAPQKSSQPMNKEDLVEHLVWQHFFMLHKIKVETYSKDPKLQIITGLESLFGQKHRASFCRPRCGGGRSLTMIFSDGFGIQFDVFYAAAMVVAPCL